MNCRVCRGGLMPDEDVVCQPCDAEGERAVKKCLDILLGIKPGLRRAVIHGLVKGVLG